MTLPDHKTKIVCTIGPASETQEVMERMLLAGMNVARLNFSHGAFDGHRKVITNLRADPYERASSQSGMYIRWYADNIWLFVPVQQKLKGFLGTLSEFPFQQGSSLNAAGINYSSIQAMQAMKRLKEIESLPAPSN